MKTLLISLMCLCFLVTGWVAGPSGRYFTRKPGTNPLPRRDKPAPRLNIVLINADDMSPTLGCYGDSVVPTPAMDGLARQGVLFENAFCSAPSCTPSRAALLTGRYPHQLGVGTNLWSTLPVQYATYVSLLETAGYRVGMTGKGWGPGDEKAGGYTRNPAGPSFPSFADFIARQPASQPFCFWLGPHDPHRPYDPALKQTMPLRPQYLTVPPYLPDTPEVRADLLDYYAEVARVEQDVAGVIKTLTQSGHLANTLIVVMGDNGLPFPRAKANLYDAGTRIPLIIAGGNFNGGKRIAAPVNLIDVAPTLLELVRLPKAKSMEGKSLTRFLTGKHSVAEPVFLERERHAAVREGNIGYPARAIRTDRFLYIQNLAPDRWPAGDSTFFKNGRITRRYGDIDDGPAKTYLLGHQQQYPALWEGAIAKRPAEELYDLTSDPYQMQNVANVPAYRLTKTQLQRQLSAWRKRTSDPRLTVAGNRIDTYPYYGN